MLQETSVTFRDFFQDKFFHVDRKYVDITMSNVLAEMAVPLDIQKLPIKPDKDDIAFLQQFPAQYWAQALHQRYYDDLRNALKDREARRAPVEKRLYGLLKRAFFTGNYDKLRGQVSEEMMTRLANGDFKHVVGDDDLTEKAARKWAELETEKHTPHANPPETEEGLPPGYKRYTFKVSRNGNKTVSFVAKPEINRLVHKLERTRGHEHHPESGLPQLGMTHGQYGYDLYGLQDGDDAHPHVTRGMQLPPRDEVATRMSDYLNHNAHQMYGKIKADDPDITWKPVGSGRTMYKDNWAWKKIYNKIFSGWNSRLSSAEPGSLTLPNGDRVPPEGGFRSENQRRATAHRLAMADTIKMAEEGKLKGPPIPGIAPEGLPVKVKSEGGKKKLDAPPLYLPHKKMPVRVKNGNGPPTVEMHDVPLVNPMEYLRQLGSEPEDYDKETGMMLVPNDQLRGHNQDYVHVPHNEFKKAKGYLAGGALHVTHNSAGRMHLDPSDPEYQERKEHIESEMQQTGLNAKNEPAQNGEGEYFYDIVKGIWNCIRSACGGMTNHEVEIMKQNVHDLHQMVYQRMMMNLRDERLDTPKGRRAFARNVASSWAQQDLGAGGGTRRLRRLSQDARSASMDATTQGESGDSLSLRDSIQQRMRDKDSGEAKIGQGEKIRPGAGQHAFPYNIDNLRTTIAEMEREAQEVDQARDQAIQMSKSQISDEIADLIGDAIADKAALTIKLEYLLTQLYLHAGSPANEAEFQAKAKVEQYSQGKTAKKMIAAFKGDADIRQMLAAPEGQQGPGQQMSLAQKDAVERLDGILKQLPPNKLKEPATQQMIDNYISEQPPEVQAVLKPMADKAFGRAAPAQPAAQPQAKKTQPSAGGPQDEANAMIRSQNWLGLANNAYFLHVANKVQLQAIIGKLEAAMQSLQGFDRDNHEFAVAHLRTLLRQRQAPKTGLDKIQ